MQLTLMGILDYKNVIWRFYRQIGEIIFLEQVCQMFNSNDRLACPNACRFSLWTILDKDRDAKNIKLKLRCKLIYVLQLPTPNCYFIRVIGKLSLRDLCFFFLQCVMAVCVAE